MPQANNLTQDFLNKNNIIAVVGVSADQHKYGHKVFFDLLHAGYQVYAIHPAGKEVNGRPRYKDLQSLPKIPDVVCLVVPPEIGITLVKECHTLGIKKIWLQPGSESEEILKYCEQHHMQVLSGVCIMIERQIIT